jgi:hypothetical protein
MVFTSAAIWRVASRTLGQALHFLGHDRHGPLHRRGRRMAAFSATLVCW